MVATAGRHKHVVNVSAMEGQFYRTTKTDKHPHTNMAKAALNMMTRTSAPDFVKDGIHMNAVDTGWVTDEDPAVHAARKAEFGFSPPLDIIDGAARIVDPIFVGALTGEHVWGAVPEGLQTSTVVTESPRYSAASICAGPRPAPSCRSRRTSAPAAARLPANNNDNGRLWGPRSRGASKRCR